MEDHPIILLIEDELQLRDNLQILLQSAGYQVTTAANGMQGIQQIRDQVFDLVITDLVLPGMDGFQVMDYLRGHNPETVVVAITGYVSTESAIQKLENTFLLSPCDPISRADVPWRVRIDVRLPGVADHADWRAGGQVQGEDLRGIHHLSTRYWKELCGQENPLPPISESQLRERLKKIGFQPGTGAGYLYQIFPPTYFR